MTVDGVMDRELYVETKYVRVVGDDAWFAGECTFHTDPTKEGRWNYIKVHDGGTPGSNGDTVWGEWFNTENDLTTAVGEFDSDTAPIRDPPSARVSITDGNTTIDVRRHHGYWSKAFSCASTFPAHGCYPEGPDWHFYIVGGITLESKNMQLTFEYSIRHGWSDAWKVLERGTKVFSVSVE